MATYRTSAYEGLDDENGEEENEEDDENEEGGKGRMLGFMFGNVDDAGDLDEEYLDQVCTLIRFAPVHATKTIISRCQFYLRVASRSFFHRSCLAIPSLLSSCMVIRQPSNLRRKQFLTIPEKAWDIFWGFVALTVECMSKNFCTMFSNEVAENYGDRTCGIIFFSVEV